MDEAKVRALVVALEECKEALDSVWAAIGDALCSGRGIEQSYANSVGRKCRIASDKAEEALLSAPDAAASEGEMADAERAALERAAQHYEKEAVAADERKSDLTAEFYRDVAKAIRALMLRAWIKSRIRFGKNQPGDAQLVEAEQCASAMETER